MSEDVDPIRILVLDRGHVMVGRCPDPTAAAFWLAVTDCRVIRRWGTTRGIGELCGGPTAETVLDALVVRESVPVRAVLRVLDVEQEKWETYLRP